LLAVFHQGKRDANQFARQGDIGLGSLHSSVLEPFQVGLEVIPTCCHCGIVDQPSVFAIALLGQLALASEFAGVTDPDIHAQEGHERIGTGELAPIKGDDQGHGSHFPDALNGLAALNQFPQTQLLEQAFDLLFDQDNERVELLQRLPERAAQPGHASQALLELLA